MEAYTNKLHIPLFWLIQNEIEHEGTGQSELKKLRKRQLKFLKTYKTDYKKSKVEMFDFHWDNSQA